MIFDQLAAGCLPSLRVVDMALIMHMLQQDMRHWVLQLHMIIQALFMEVCSVVAT